MIAPVSSQLPWMVSPGNHEIEQIFVKEIDSNGEQFISSVALIPLCSVSCLATGRVSLR